MRNNEFGFQFLAIIGYFVSLDFVHNNKYNVILLVYLTNL